MPYQLVFTDEDTRRALRFLKRHPELKARYTKTLALLEASPHQCGGSRCDVLRQCVTRTVCLNAQSASSGFFVHWAWS